MGYMDEVLGISEELSGGHAAPVELLDSGEPQPPEKELGYEDFLDFDESDMGLLASIVDEELAASENPCWEGYVQIGMKEKNGKSVPNCVPADEAALLASGDATPSSKKIKFTDSILASLEKKAEQHNGAVESSAGKKVTLTSLKAVYRRGAGALSMSQETGQNPNFLAMARVNAYLNLLEVGEPKNSKYTTDNDLLPKLHPRSTQ